MKNLKLILFPVIRIIFLFLIITLITFNFNKSYVIAQWILQTVPDKADIILSVDFTDYRNGIIGGWGYENSIAKGKSFYTLNSGKEWKLAHIPDSVRAIVGAEFINAQTGFMVGAYNTSVQSSKQEQISGPNLLINNYYENIKIDDEQNYVAIILKTTNGGLNWFTYNNNISPFYNYLYKTDFLDSSKGLLIGMHQINTRLTPGLLKTTNTGQSWIEISTPVDSGDFRNVKFLNDNLILATGYEYVSFESSLFYYGIVIRSTDGGISWQKFDFLNVNNFTDIDFSDSNIGLAVGIQNSNTNYLIVLFTKLRIPV